MNIRKIFVIVSILLVACLLFPQKVYAIESMYWLTGEDNAITLDAEDQSTVFREYKDFQVGDCCVISEDENGVLLITCIKAVDTISRYGINTSRRTFDITNSLFGVNYHVVTVEIVCEWFADGADGFVISLNGTYSDVRLGWSCSWESSPYPYDSQYVKTRVLDIYHLTNTYYQNFTGLYNPYSETLSIDTY